MTPAEIREAVARLVEAGAKATPGEWQWGISGHEGIVAYDGDNVLFVASFASNRDEGFVITAANARPALAALAGMCVLPVEVVKKLTPFAGEHWCGNEDCEVCAAFAAAEAEVARVEGG